MGFYLKPECTVKIIVFIIASCGFLLYGIQASAEVYEWVDEQGQRHFSDQKPSTQDEYQVRNDIDDARSPSQAAAPEKYAQSQRKKKRSKKARSNTRRHRQRQAKARQQKQQRCEKYLAQMRKVQTQLRRGYREPQGNRLRQRRYELSKRYQKECR